MYCITINVLHSIESVSQNKQSLLSKSLNEVTSVRYPFLSVLY